MIAIDTNLLVYAHRSGTPEHRRAEDALRRAVSDPTGWGLSLPVVAEFWSIVTHPKNAGGPSSPARAAAFIRGLISGGAMNIWMPSAGFSERLLDDARARSITRARIFDLQIALIAADAGATELWTHDSNFVSVPGLRVRDPL